MEQMQTAEDEQKSVTFIPAKPKTSIYEGDHKYRACAYCRVSTDNDEQLSSFELQQAHYEQVVQDHPNWMLKKIYADKGISGTSLKNRKEFDEMIKACMRGEYDLIVTKSVSRFARNLVDCISLIRKLKGLNPPVGVYFETDNLYTLAENTEFMLSFLATFAQEESVKKSEAMYWSLQQRFKDGKLLTPAPYGYNRQKDSANHYIKYAPLVINESEAKVVAFIYDAYIYGWAMEQIASFLNDIEVPTKTGAKPWTVSALKYILTNERYCGNILTWKTFTSDMFEHKHRKNQHDRDQYLYTGRHPAIIPSARFDQVQDLIAKRKHHIKGGVPSMHVIDEGIFRGFIPINHHWVNDDPGAYYDISNSINQRSNRQRRIEKSSICAFDLQGYQVVRGQFLQNRFDGPTLTISNEHIGFNKFCMQKFESVAYVQLLLHPTERKIAIRPCNKEDSHSIRWRPDASKPLYSKTLNCQHFGTALYSIMKWNPDYTYKIRGVWAVQRTEQIIVFNLPNALPAMLMPSEDEENGKPRRRVSLCPEDMTNDFGDEFYEHTLDNGFYYIAPKGDWKSQSQGIIAPGMERFAPPSEEQLQMSIDDLLRGKNA